MAMASAEGGLGGYATNGPGGNGGSVSATASANSDFGGSVVADAIAIGGGVTGAADLSGGGDEIQSGNAAAADVVTDPLQGRFDVSGYSSGGSVSLSAAAHGGGYGAQVLRTTGPTGLGGNGVATIITSSTHSETSFTVRTLSTGGAGLDGGGGGGGGPSLDEGAGYSDGNGTATGGLTGSGATTLSVFAQAVGGLGGSGVDFVTGNGGLATATGTSQNNGNGDAAASASAVGGTGGSNGELDGGSFGGFGGDGGAATATATATSATGNANATAVAQGGNGGGGWGSLSGHASGDAGTAVATATATGIIAVAQATASGGGSGPPQDGASYGSGGTATATATANGIVFSEIADAGPNGVGNAVLVRVVSDLSGNTLSMGSPPVNASSFKFSGGIATIPGIMGGSLTIGDGMTPATLQLSSNSGASSLTSLTIESGSTLDIANNHLFINYGSDDDPLSTIAGYLASGYNGGAWNGTGIDSSTSALPGNGHFGVGYADGADGVVTGLSSGQIEIKYTLYGDANLDGVVSGADFTILVGKLGKSVSGWDKGDFNYDGVVSGADFTLLIGNLGKQANGADLELPASDYAAIDAFAAANGLLANVPEPSTGSVVGLFSIGILKRRRKFCEIKTGQL
jgi:hypothetical protein